MPTIFFYTRKKNYLFLKSDLRLLFFTIRLFQEMLAEVRWPLLNPHPGLYETGNFGEKASKRFVLKPKITDDSLFFLRFLSNIIVIFLPHLQSFILRFCCALDWNPNLVYRLDQRVKLNFYQKYLTLSNIGQHLSRRRSHTGQKKCDNVPKASKHFFL